MWAAAGQYKAESKIKPRLRGETVVYLNPSCAIDQLVGFGEKNTDVSESVVYFSVNWGKYMVSGSCANPGR